MTETLTNGLALMRFGGGRGGGAFFLLVVLAVAVVGIMALMRPRTDSLKQ
jgi:hypothetical protein